MAEAQSDLTFIALVSALSCWGCPVCRLTGRWERRYVRNLFEESVNDVSTRKALHESLGFCQRHAAMALAVQDALGTAIIYGALVEDIQQRLALLLEAPPTGRIRRRQDRQRRHALSTRGPCPGCAQRAMAEDVYIGMLLYHWTQPEMQNAYAASDGLCLPHLRKATSMVGAPAEAIAWLLREEAGKFAVLADALARLRKHFDYRFHHEPQGVEADIWQRAVRKFAGEDFTHE